MVVSTLSLDRFNNDSGYRASFLPLFVDLLLHACQAPVVFQIILSDVFMERILVPKDIE
jgi:hypothetical protein